MRENEIKTNSCSPFKILKASIEYFAYKRKDKLLIIITLMVFILIKNILHGYSNLIMLRMKGEKKDIYLNILNDICVKVFSEMGSFIVDALFENTITPYGSNISEMILFKMMKSNDSEVYQQVPSKFEYYIIESGKEMASLNKLIFIKLWSKMIYFIVDIYGLMMLDQNLRIPILSILIISIGIVNIIKWVCVKYLTQVLRINTFFSYKREKLCNEIMENIQIIKGYGCEKHAIDKFMQTSKAWEYTKIDNIYFTNMFRYIDNITESFLVGIISSFYIFRTKKFVFAELKFIITNSFNILDSSVNIVLVCKNILESIAIADAIMQYFEFTVEERKKFNYIDSFNDKIEIKNLTYFCNNKLIFSDVNIVINKGEKVILNGSNGAGKSSILKLLLKLDHYQGDILIDGINLKNIYTKDYRLLITYVPQDTRLFDDSIYANILFGNNASFKEIIYICKKLGIHNTIMKFPLGYNTIVGEFGKNLNGGLRQKIFYARAFLRDTPIYIFDEPTNNLDHSSTFFNDIITDPQYKDKTFFVISHDMNLISHFPKKYTFLNNKILLVN